MPIVSLKDLRAQLPKGRRVIGIDHSKKAWGLALANPALTIATPLSVISCTKFTQDVVTLAKICAEYDVGGFIIGLPLNMDGSEGPRTESVRHFADNLVSAREKLGFEPVISFFDERLSTHAADSFLENEMGLSREKRKGAVDKIAAQFILQAALAQA